MSEAKPTEPKGATSLDLRRDSAHAAASTELDELIRRAIGRPDTSGNHAARTSRTLWVAALAALVPVFVVLAPRGQPHGIPVETLVNLLRHSVASTASASCPRLKTSTTSPVTRPTMHQSHLRRLQLPPRPLSRRRRPRPRGATGVPKTGPPDRHGESSNT